MATHLKKCIHHLSGLHIGDNNCENDRIPRTMNDPNSITGARIQYFKAVRCWKTHNLRSSINICDQLNKVFTKPQAAGQTLDGPQWAQLRQLVWFLKMKCLAENYHINESLILNEDEIDSDEDQVRLLMDSRKGRQTSLARNTSTRTMASDLSNKRTATLGGKTRDIRRPVTGMITGRTSILSSRQSSRGASSYRPLTTSLTATQTAFSRSTRPLLRYATSSLLAKPAFEYLYNAQTITNKCPDYRQCLEFLNLVQGSVRKRQRNLSRVNAPRNRTEEDKSLLINTDVNLDEDKMQLGAFWLIWFGVCYYHLKMTKQAEEYLQLAIELNPKQLDPYTWLVKIYLRSNQPIKVLKFCENGLKESRSPLLYNWLARVQSLMGDHYAAHHSLRSCLEFFPTNVEALANVGYFSFYEDKHEQALKCFERIEQMTSYYTASLDMNQSLMGGNSSRLLNNLALCNFYIGFYHKVMPLFTRALINSPSKEVNSEIWYNISFVPLACGLRNLAIGCLKLALKNDSQNEEAMNNLGVLKYQKFIDDYLNFPNKLELPGVAPKATTKSQSDSFENLDDQKDLDHLYDDAETYFSLKKPSDPDTLSGSTQDDLIESSTSLSEFELPERLFNMALIKRKRGQLLASVHYCNLYMQQDDNNYQVKKIINEIKQLTMHDA